MLNYKKNNSYPNIYGRTIIKSNNSNNFNKTITPTITPTIIPSPKVKKDEEYYKYFTDEEEDTSDYY